MHEEGNLQVSDEEDRDSGNGAQDNDENVAVTSNVSPMDTQFMELMDQSNEQIFASQLASNPMALVQQSSTPTS